MKKLAVFAGVFALAVASAGCASSSDYAQAKSPQSCEQVAKTENSAWVHGQGAPGGQEQIGYGRSMEKVTAERREMARSCQSGNAESL